MTDRLFETTFFKSFSLGQNLQQTKLWPKLGPKNPPKSRGISLNENHPDSARELTQLPRGLRR